MPLSCLLACQRRATPFVARVGSVRFPFNMFFMRCPFAEATEQHRNPIGPACLPTSWFATPRYTLACAVSTEASCDDRQGTRTKDSEMASCDCTPQQKLILVCTVSALHTDTEPGATAYRDSPPLEPHKLGGRRDMSRSSKEHSCHGGKKTVLAQRTSFSE